MMFEFKILKGLYIHVSACESTSMDPDLHQVSYDGPIRARLITLCYCDAATTTWDFAAQNATFDLVRVMRDVR